ncbi:hypothetical protein GBAR_LOCUS2200, partial [Geodia barretti]
MVYTRIWAFLHIFLAATHFLHVFNCFLCIGTFFSLLHVFSAHLHFFYLENLL